MATMMKAGESGAIARVSPHPAGCRALSRGLAGLFLAVALLGAPALAPEARAADDKVAPGSGCVPANGNLPTGARFALSNTTLLNVTEDAFLRVDCPITKERIGTGILTASIFVIDNNGAASVDCELFSVAVVPNAVTSVTRAATRSTSVPGGSIVARQLNLGGLPPVAGIGSNWFIGCTLPPFSGIVSYHANEQP